MTQLTEGAFALLLSVLAREVPAGFRHLANDELLTVDTDSQARLQPSEWYVDFHPHRLLS
jgi:hypothetical protein